MSIAERQNRTESIEKLAAQRLLYARAKALRNWRFLLIIAVGMLGIMASLSQDTTLGHIVTVLVLTTWALDELFLKRPVVSLKNEAAAIQEDFDCIVLDIPWPEFKVIARPTPDRVRDLANQAERQNMVENLRDWYPPASIPDDPDLARAHCQRINCWWDLNLRKRFQTLLVVSFAVFVCLAAILAITTGITVAKLVALVVAGLRLIVWGYSELESQRTAISRIQHLHEQLSKYGDRNTPSMHACRSLQDEILEHRRSNSPVPEWLYWKHRDSQEQQCADS